MAQTLLKFLKLAVPLALFVYLLTRVGADEYATFWNEPKNWWLLLAAQGLGTLAIVVSFLRWYVLVRAFDIPFTLPEALRLGFLGYLLNFVSFGSVGGDLFKAILVARDKPEKRPEAVASVLLDRALGLLGLVVLAFLCLSMAVAEQLSVVMNSIRDGAALIALTSIVSLAIALFSGQWFERLIDWIARFPMVGMPLARMARAVRLLRSRPQVLLVLLGLALTVHFLIAVSVYLISAGTYSEHPKLDAHLMVVPPAMAAGTLPIAPGGIGFQEGALVVLFRQLPNLPASFSPVLVATLYRLLTLFIAGIGLAFYYALPAEDKRAVNDSKADRTDSQPE